MTHIDKVIFVCSNNSFLSPLAEAFYRSYGSDDLPECISRGMVVLFPEPINPKVNMMLVAKGEELSKHGNTVELSEEDLTDYTCILTMTLSEKVKVMEKFKTARVFTIGEFTKEATDILDPYGKEDEVYEEVFDAVLKNVKACIRRIKTINGGVGMIALGSDHGGYELKQDIIAYLEENNIAYNDYGCYDSASCDYPIYAKAVANAVAGGECTKGIIICGTGIGVSITANKVPGIRAALCHDTFSAEATRLHNDANVLTMGARVVGPGLALKIVETFLNTEFSEDERHIRRISMIED
ncbi:MAG: ribose 5-phosphate isomerase B [Lachnospiraceae bacterium]|nr:ribose 5-phosphate isomerase B [Lachnospiraceae bacterium]